ncbi:hypothetical protein Tco_1004832 [Tanacetum coccineum]|uniref:Uncharacterized protein n=1 Tax=Tanacetum coccineum TaxID=301880 RepID=A0ABQ5FE17_9ASTR
MAVLDSCPKHNMVAYLEKTKGNAEFHEIIDIHSSAFPFTALTQRFPSKRFSKKHRVHKESVSKQGRKFAKGESSVQGNPLFDEIPKDTVDHMETENAQDEGRTREMVDEDKEIDENILSTEDVLSTDKEVVSTDKEVVSTDKEKVSTDRPIVSTDGSKISTDRQIEGTDEQNEGTEEHIEGTEEHIEGTEEHIEGTEEHIEGTEEQVESTDGQRKGTEDHTEERSATQATQTPTSTMFGDDETIAKVLLNMSQAKAVSREKEKAEKKFKQLESDEEMARKIQEEWEEEEERNRIAEEKATNEALIRNFDDIKARIEADRLLAEKLQEQEREQFTTEERAKFLHDTILLAQRKFPCSTRIRSYIRSDEDFISIGSAKDERLIKRMNEKGVDLSKSEVIKEESKEEVQKESKKEESTRKRKLGVHTLVTETGLIIHMMVEKKYPLRKKVLIQMLKLKLESEEDSTIALELIRFIKKILAELEPDG